MTELEDIRRLREKFTEAEKKRRRWPEIIAVWAGLLAVSLVLWVGFLKAIGAW